MTTPAPLAADLMVAALDHPTAERTVFLDRACRGDETLRREVESLLAAHDHTGFLDRPVARFAPPAQAGALAPGRRVQRYELREMVGAGGMGVVYRAWDDALGRTVALKFLPPHRGADAQARERFRVEAQAAAALDHPNICTIHEIGETEDGQLFIAMPFYEGETAAERIARGPLPVADAVALIRQAADGLAKAHERGIVHRDVKPANLMVTADGVVKVLDFGIAKLAHLALTGPGARQGTVAYMSPEQARGDPVDGRTDVWSLGVVLHEMLTGRRLFNGGNVASMVQALLHAEPDWGALRELGVPNGVERTLRRALTRDLAARHPTAADLAADLEAALPGAPRALPSRTVSHDASDGERRQATVAACRIAGYARLVEHVGPAAADRAAREVHTAAEALASANGGFVEREGTEAMAMVFGLPVAHEDDCLRATRAVLELSDRVRDISAPFEERGAPPLRLRAGIDAGVVVAHPSTTSLAPFEIGGPAASTAAQLASLAPAGEVWISAEARRLVEGFVWTEPRTPIALGDRAQPLVPHRITGESGLHTRIEAAERMRGLTPFTGRDEELDLLLGQLERTADGTGRIVSVIGEAGLGKSRLLHELRQRLDEREVPQLLGRCPAHGSGAAYLPFIEVLRDALELGDARTADAPASVVAERARASGAELEEFIPFYLHLLSIPSNEFPLPQHLRGEQFRVAVQEALAALVTVSARRRPTVLLLEDWHWADNASRAALGQIADLVAEHPLLVVVTTRPGREEEWSTNPSHHALPLRSLGPLSSLAMLRALLRADEVPVELAALLHERTGGNPFFLEELCQTLLEEGIIRVDAGAVTVGGRLDELHVPDTVQAVIRARLDRLHRDTREVLRLASVVGREFTRRILEQTMPDDGRLPNALDALKAAGLVQQTRVVPDAAYRFKHVLTQEVAYDGLLEHRRRELHGRVGAAIEQIYGGRLDEQLGRLAHHFSRAEQWDAAVRYGMRAAQRADALAQFAEALDILERSRSWLARLPDDAARRETFADLLLRQERLCETLGLRERQQRIIDELVARLENAGDHAKLAEVYVRQGDLFTLLRQFEAADAALARSLQLRRELGDQVGVRNTLRSLGLLRWHEGRDREALPPVEEALAIDRALGDGMAIVGDLSNVGYVLKGLGDHERASAYLLEGLMLSDHIIATSPDAAIRADVELKQCYLLHNLANLSRELGDATRALEYYERARVRAGKRFPIQLSYHYTSLAHMQLQVGRIEEAVELYRAAVDLTRQARFVPGLVQSLRMLGEVLLGLGRRADALPHLEEAVVLFAQLKDRAGEADLWTRLAAAHEEDDAQSDAMAAWAKARALRQQLGDAAGEIESLEGLGRATRRHIGEPSLALSYYREAATLAAASGEARIEGRLRNTIGIIEWSRGAYRPALAEYERAATIFRTLGDDASLGLMLNSVGATLKAMSRFPEAGDRLREALGVHRRAGQPRLEGHALALLGEIALALDESEEASSLLEASLAIRRQLGDLRGEGWMLQLLGRAFVARDRPDRARESLAQAERSAMTSGDNELLAACQELRRTSGL